MKHKGTYKLQRCSSVCGVIEVIILLDKGKNTAYSLSSFSILVINVSKILDFS